MTDGESRKCLISQSFHETCLIGEIIGENLNKGDIVALIGELGAGKTSIAQGIAKGLGVNEQVTSPTFTIINEYEGTLPLYHFDLYRIHSINELHNLGYEEYFYAEGVCLIEWAGKIEDILQENENTLFLYLTYIDETMRKINIYANHDKFKKILKELERRGF